MRVVKDLIKKIKNRLTNKINRSSVFVTSTGRTGTNFFEMFINDNCQDSYCVHEPLPDFFQLGMEKVRGQKGKTEINSSILNSRRHIVDGLTAGVKYIESNPFIFPILDNVKSVFGKCKFVIIVRNPEDYIISAYNKATLSDNSAHAYSENDPRKRVSALDFPNDRFHLEWNDFSRVEKIAWYWNYCNKTLFDFYLKNSDYCLLIKFEDLFSDEDEKRMQSIKKVFNFIKVKFRNDRDLLNLSRQKKNQNHGKLVEDFDSLISSDSKRYYQITKEMRGNLNY